MTTERQKPSIPEALLLAVQELVQKSAELSFHDTATAYPRRLQDAATVLEELRRAIVASKERE